jgi:hypothetical protein
MHFHILPDHQKSFINKDIFESLEWLKTCFDAFAKTSRHPEFFFQKRYFWTSGVVKKVFWCICAYFQITRNFFSKKIFFPVWSGKRRVLFHFRILPHHQKLFFKKDIIERLERLKTCFDAFSHTSRPPESCP